MNPYIRKLSNIAMFLAVICLTGISTAESAPAPSADWQRVTAYVNGVFSPRGYFNLLVGLYSLPTLKSAQFNLGQSTIVLDFPPDTLPITIQQIQHIEKIAGYRPGPVKIRAISPASFVENGPGWIPIKHPKSSNAFVRWAKQNF